MSASNGPENLASRSCSKQRTFSNRSSIARLRACWHIQAPSGFAVTPARCTRRDPCSTKNSTYKVRSQAVSTVKKSHATIPCACARRNAPHDVPRRRGAGPKPERLRIDLIVVAPTGMPSLHSSPWIRTQPHLEFSRARRNTSPRSAGSSGGRPGQRRRYLHFLRTSSRCQRSSVCGETRNTDQRSRGSSPPAAASSSRSPLRSSGRFAVRRSTASWCRSTAFSTSSAATDELPTQTRSNLRIAKNTKNKSTSRSYGSLSPAVRITVSATLQGVKTSVGAGSEFDSRHRKTPSRVRFRPPPPGTFRISPCGIQRTALRNGFNLVASRTRCDGNATRAELTDQEVGPRKFAKSASFVLAPDEYRLEPRARLWAGEADVEGGVAERIRDESLCVRGAISRPRPR